MNPLLQFALDYAAKGIYVFPIHNPILNNGKCTGCTCESYRHSEECRVNHPRLYLKPNERCQNPGKCPRVRWSEKSTIDEATIRKWWGKPWGTQDIATGKMVWAIPNIGIDDGKSRLLILDRDKYKSNYVELELSIADQTTVTSQTGQNTKANAGNNSGIECQKENNIPIVLMVSPQPMTSEG